MGKILLPNRKCQKKEIHGKAKKIKFDLFSCGKPCGKLEVKVVFSLPATIL
jgi:hypothetical protein